MCEKLEVKLQAVTGIFVAFVMIICILERGGSLVGFLKLFFAFVKANGSILSK